MTTDGSGGAVTPRSGRENRLTVLFLVPDLHGSPGGIARYCEIVCQSLLREGADLTAVALHDGEASRRAVSRDFPGMRYVPCAGNRARFVAEVFRATLRRPAVVHTAHAHFAAVARLAAVLARARLVVTFHGTEVWDRMSAIRRFGLHGADIYLAVSAFTAERAVQANNFDPRKVRVLHNCLAPQFERPEGDPLITTPSMLTVACTTPVVPSKGHDVALRALALLLPEFSELTYHIVGGGDGEESLRTLAADLGVTDAVRFHGVIDDRSLSRLYENSSVFVMPSSSEGFGFAFLEAMARGTPAVGGNQDATPEVVLHGVTGFVVDPRSPREVADAVAAILRDEALRHRMSEAAVERAYSQFSFDEFQRRLLSILRGTGSSHSVLPAGTRAEGRSRETSLGDTGRAADG